MEQALIMNLLSLIKNKMVILWLKLDHSLATAAVFEDVCPTILFIVCFTFVL